jgi:hypothetical protein
MFVKLLEVSFKIRVFFRCDLCSRLYTEERVLFNHKLRYHKLGEITLPEKPVEAAT